MDLFSYRIFPTYVSIDHDRRSTCDKLDCQIKASIAPNQSAKIQLELHHRKAEGAREVLKQDTIESQEPESTKCILSMYLQQVMFVPALTHNDMFYLSQLSCYNLEVHIGDTNEAYMYMCHESRASRGANEIVSCLLHIVNRGLTQKKHLVIWCNNCGDKIRIGFYYLH
ncbi:hypothetical protein NQ314_015795 [Rhamnusium bicolor]|uniref:Uncharacterized protein n=1 Tax=Rhamnusium bicolor TaxID=1586634 RepID=A0AAV8WXT4_9CUCU|nr:hypothetical protein NQ314_015795 [Rhamnusium bicolor]